MRILILAVAMFLVAAPTFAVEKAPETKPLSAEEKKISELDALRLEKADLSAQVLQAEIGRLQERLERVKEQAVGYIREIQRRDSVEGWQLDLAARKWVKPAEKVEEGK